MAENVKKVEAITEWFNGLSLIHKSITVFVAALLAVTGVFQILDYIFGTIILDHIPQSIFKLICIVCISTVILLVQIVRDISKSSTYSNNSDVTTDDKDYSIRENAIIGGARLKDNAFESINLNDILNLAQDGDLNFNWPSGAGVYNTLFSQMDEYRSTEWICSPDHVECIGRKQLPNALMTRIKTSKTFKFEKTFIISKDLWASSKTWECMWEVFSTIKDNSKKHVDIRVIKQENVDGLIDEKYFDMGIYKIGTRQFVGFLNHHQSVYKWLLAEKSCKEAEQNFVKLNTCAETNESILEMLTNKHVIAKRLGLTGK